MPRKETMTSATRRYLRQCREWLPATHPLAVALERTAEQLDRGYQTSMMAVYNKQIEQIERRRPSANQPALLPGGHLIGPRAS